MTDPGALAAQACCSARVVEFPSQQSHPRVRCAPQECGGQGVHRGAQSWSSNAVERGSCEDRGVRGLEREREVKGVAAARPESCEDGGVTRAGG